MQCPKCGTECKIPIAVSFNNIGDSKKRNKVGLSGEGLEKNQSKVRLQADKDQYKPNSARSIKKTVGIAFMWLILAVVLVGSGYLAYREGVLNTVLQMFTPDPPKQELVFAQLDIGQTHVTNGLVLQDLVERNQALLTKLTNDIDAHQSLKSEIELLSDGVQFQKQIVNEEMERTSEILFQLVKYSEHWPDHVSEIFDEKINIARRSGTKDQAQILTQMKLIVNYSPLDKTESIEFIKSELNSKIGLQWSENEE